MGFSNDFYGAPAARLIRSKALITKMEKAQALGMPDAFAEYTRIVVERLSDKVKYWLTINEPCPVTHAGYITGIRAPFLQEPSLIFPVTRNIMLAHGRAVQVIREPAKCEPKIGLALSGTVVEPCDHSKEGVDAARWKMFGEDTMSVGNIAW